MKFDKTINIITGAYRTGNNYIASLLYEYNNDDTVAISEKDFDIVNSNKCCVYDAISHKIIVIA